MSPASLQSSEEYLKRKALYEQFGYNLEIERQAVLNKIPKPGLRILEIGTGKGYLTLVLAKRGYTFTTIDISEVEQVEAKKNISAIGLQNQVNFVVCDAQDLPFSDRSFDTIFCVNSFHHIKNQFAVLREMIRVCDKEGSVVISDFNSKGFKVVGEIHRSEGREHQFFEVCWEAMGYVLEKKNFQVELSETEHQKILLAKHR